MSEISSHTLRALTEAFSERLSDVTPSESSDGVGPEEIESKLKKLVNQPGDLGENLLLAAYSILDTHQDRVVRDLKRGWPTSHETVLGVSNSGAQLSYPEAELIPGGLRLWYGRKEDPVLELQPIYRGVRDSGVWVEDTRDHRLTGKGDF